VYGSRATITPHFAENIHATTAVIAPVGKLTGRNIQTFAPWTSALAFLVGHAKWGGSVAEWLTCWTQAQKGLGSNRSLDAVG